MKIHRLLLQLKVVSLSISFMTLGFYFLAFGVLGKVIKEDWTGSLSIQVGFYRLEYSSRMKSHSKEISNEKVQK